MDDEPGLGVSRGCTACVIGLNDMNATPGNVAKAMLVAILDGAAEGTAWGASLLAKYRRLSVAGQAPEWSAFLAGHATGTPIRFTPRPAATAIYREMDQRHRRLVALDGQFESAVG